MEGHASFGRPQILTPSLYLCNGSILRYVFPARYLAHPYSIYSPFISILALHDLTTSPMTLCTLYAMIYALLSSSLYLKFDYLPNLVVLTPIGFQPLRDSLRVFTLYSRYRTRSFASAHTPYLTHFSSHILCFTHMDYYLTHLGFAFLCKYLL